MGEGTSLDSPRRTFIKTGIAAVGAALGLAVPESRNNEALNQEVINYDGSNLAELQTLIEASGKQKIRVVLSKDVLGDGKQVRDIEQVPVGDLQPGKEKVPFTVGLYLSGAGEEGKSISITSKDPKKPVSIVSNSNFGIYADGVELTLSQVKVQQGVSKDDIPDRFEQAHVFVKKGSLTAEGVEVRGEKDTTGKASNGVDKGLTGFYLLDTKATINNCSFLNSSWDSITTSGSDVVIKDCSIYGFSKIQAGAGIGVIRSGKVDIIGLSMTDRVKGVIGFGSPNITIKDSYIKCSSHELSDWYAIAAPEEGSLTIENSLIISTGNIVTSFNKNTRLVNNALIYDRAQGIPSSLRFFDSSIWLPNTDDSLVGNRIYATVGTPGWEIIAFWDETEVDGEVQPIDRYEATNVARKRNNEIIQIINSRERDKFIQEERAGISSRRKPTGKK